MFKRIISRFPFFWLLPIVKLGLKTSLNKSDVEQLKVMDGTSGELGSLMGRHWEEDGCSCSGRKPNLIKILLKIFLFPILQLGLLTFAVECVLKIGSSVVLFHLIKYYSMEEERSLETGYRLITLLITVQLLTLLLHHPAFYGFEKIGLKIRIAVSSLIFRKVVRISLQSMNEVTIGRIVTLLSNDVIRLEKMAIYCNYIWVAPIQVLVATFVVWQEIGVCCMAGIVFIFLTLPFQSFMGKLFSKYRKITVQRTDQRVQVINEVISAIGLIKMYAWEWPFQRRVEQMRESEIKAISKSNYLKSISSFLANTCAKTAAFSVTTALIFMHKTLSAQKVFFMISLINKIESSIMINFYNAVSTSYEAFISCKRIQAFLELEEKEFSPSLKINSMHPIAPQEMFVLAVNKLNARYGKLSKVETLSEITFCLKKGELLFLRGITGSGKTTLFHVIMGELPNTSGSINVHGELSFFTQSPWLFSGSIRDNILFGQQYDFYRYIQVVKACCLDEDFANLPNGDKTLIGSGKSSLSGGQKARIHLARVVYYDADLYLLDDPLSALNSEVARHIYERCIEDLLKEKSVILASHQTPTSMARPTSILLLKDRKGEYQKTEMQYVEAKTCIPVSVPAEFERRRKKRNSSSTYSSMVHGNESSYLYVKEPNEMDEEHSTGINCESISHGENFDNENDGMLSVNFNARNSKSAVLNILLKYFTTGVAPIKITFFLLFSIASRITFVLADSWLSEWTQQIASYQEMRKHSNHSSSHNLSIIEPSPMDNPYNQLVYNGIFVSFLLTSLLEAVIFYQICTKASQSLHKTAFRAILRAKMNYFKEYDCGEILNRFTKDIGQIDDVLPKALFDLVGISLVLVITGTVIYKDVWMVFPAVLLTALLVYIRHGYVLISTDLKRIEATTRGILFDHVKSVYEGLVTIRSFRSERTVIKKFDQHQDLHTSSSYIYLAVTRSFTIFLDMISTIFVAFVVIGFIIQSDITGSDVGLTLSLAMTLAVVLTGSIRQSAEVENLLISVERILEFANVQTELLQEFFQGYKTFSSKQEGRITYKNVSVYFSEDENPILKHLNLNIEPGEKVGIIGRTGSGKSSLISSLFRLYSYSGTITIDDEDIDSLDLEDLRSSISVIPQEPTLFSETLKFNLDPFNKYSNSQIWNALTQVNMKSVISNAGGDLDTKIQENSLNFSVGQKQLLCLARAILERNKILVMDEATSNIDFKTDALMQRVIREKFSSCTILSVAHRIQTITDYDKIIVLENGSIKDFGAPKDILSDLDVKLTNENCTSYP